MYTDEQLLKFEAEEFISSNPKLYKYIYNQALDDMANRIKEYSGEHHLHCDGYFGGQTELVFRTEEFLEEVLEQLKEKNNECKCN